MTPIVFIGIGALLLGALGYKIIKEIKSEDNKPIENETTMQYDEKGVNGMEKYLDYWMKGWKVWLMMICTHLVFLIWVIPIAIISVIIFGKHDFKVPYYILCTIIGISIAPYLTYRVFIFFYPQVSGKRRIRIEQ